MWRINPWGRILKPQMTLSSLSAMLSSLLPSKELSMRKRLIIFLILPLMLMSFHARHIIPEQDYRSAITTQYLTPDTITAGADKELCWDKLIVTGIVLSSSTTNANHINDIALVFIGLLSLNTNRRKSHIEYCGKKMVRAIMLQFHPRLHRLFPAFIAGIFLQQKRGSAIGTSFFYWNLFLYRDLVDIYIIS